MPPVLCIVVFSKLTLAVGESVSYSVKHTNRLLVAGRFGSQCRKRLRARLRRLRIQFDSIEDYRIEGIVRKYNSEKEANLASLVHLHSMRESAFCYAEFVDI